jgi:hypothetical protein
MLRLVSLLGIACLAVAAVALKSSARAAQLPAPNHDSLDAQNRITASVSPIIPKYHARFSLN